ncbi:MAG: DEAD/DEAH box helicase [Selenomonadaceae bacterium]|nr:DEAD/DEAH box helicase [Selenomonadaceae bacterium]
MQKTFNDLKITPDVCELLKKQGIINPTVVQEKLIPTARSGKDVIVQSKTGTGKTLAFLLPMMERIKKIAVTQALIVAPTRELALQISKVAANLGTVMNIDSVIICGGQDFERQKEKLKHSPQLIIGTPGRILDHLSRKAIDLSHVNKIVIDEADEMLKLGFIEDVETLIRAASNDSQLILCSATIPERIKRLAAQFMENPQTIFIEPKVVTLDSIKQSVIRVKEGAKLDKLCELLDQEQPYLAMIFCAKKEKTTWLSIELAQRGWEVDALNGDLTQQQRNFVLKKFREAKLQILVSTDIAARGLDIEGVTHVISFDIPPTPVDYIHRIGRTGRAGQTGRAITFVTDSEVDRLKLIETGIKKQLNIENKRQENKKPRRINEINKTDKQAPAKKATNERSKINDRSQKRSGNSVRRRSSTGNERSHQRRGK